jgi:hypothetical protein
VNRRRQRTAVASPDPTDELAQAEQEVVALRRDREEVARLVMAREVAASALHTSDYRIAGALERLQRLRLYVSTPEPEPPATVRQIRTRLTSSRRTSHDPSAPP